MVLGRKHLREMKLHTQGFKVCVRPNFIIAPASITPIGASFIKSNLVLEAVPVLPQRLFASAAACEMQKPDAAALSPDWHAHTHVGFPRGDGRMGMQKAACERSVSYRS